MSLFGLFEKRLTLESPAVPLTNAGLLSLLGGQETDSGIAVTEEGSLQMSAVWRATTLISSLGGALPIGVYDAASNKRTGSQLLADPHPDMTPYELWKLSYVHRCLWGNSYQQKIRDGARRIQWLYPMSPWRMKAGKARKPAEGNPTGKVFEFTKDDGSKEVLTPNEVLHIPGLSYDGVCGVSPVRAASQAIGLSLAAEKSAAKLFGSGNLLSGILQTEQRLTQEQADTLQERWRSKFMGVDRAYEVAVLDSGAEFQSMTMPNSDAQMLESRDFSITELARYFGVPPYLMFQTEKSTSWGTALEQQATGFVKFDLHPQWLAPTEQRITKELTGSRPAGQVHRRGPAERRHDGARRVLPHHARAGHLERERDPRARGPYPGRRRRHVPAADEHGADGHRRRAGREGQGCSSRQSQDEWPAGGRRCQEMINFGTLPVGASFTLSSDADFYQEVTTDSGTNYPVGATMVIKWLSSADAVLATWSATLSGATMTFNVDKTVVAALLVLTPVQGRVIYQDVGNGGPELLIAKGSIRDISPLDATR